MIADFRELLAYRDFLLQYTLQQLRNRYRSSVLGFLWTLLTPLVTFITFSVLFSYITHQPLRTYGVYFFAGYLPWTFFLSSATAANFAVAGNAHYVTRISVPNVVFPVATVLVNLVDFVAAIPVLLGVMIFAGAPIGPALFILPVSTLVLAVFALGISLLFATVNVFLRDFHLFWGSASFFWFFFTPILYAITTIPEGPRAFFAWNPMVPLLQLFQDPVSKGAVPDAQTFLISVALAVSALIAGLVVFSRSQRSFYLYL
jgi:ABC-type polysaccharide/polyol phosphate export permease